MKPSTFCLAYGWLFLIGGAAAAMVDNSLIALLMGAMATFCLLALEICRAIDGLKQ